MLSAYYGVGNGFIGYYQDGRFCPARIDFWPFPNFSRQKCTIIIMITSVLFCWQGGQAATRGCWQGRGRRDGSGGEIFCFFFVISVLALSNLEHIMAIPKQKKDLNPRWFREEGWVVRNSQPIPFIWLKHIDQCLSNMTWTYWPGEKKPTGQTVGPGPESRLRRCPC